MKNTDEPIIVEQAFDASIQEIWNAITELSQMTKWFFAEIEAFEPKIGFETRFIIHNEGKIFPHYWKITEVEPNKKISYNWKYEGFEGNSHVTFELSEQKNGTKLTLTHQVTESFPQNIDEFVRESCSRFGYFNHSIRMVIRPGTRYII